MAATMQDVARRCGLSIPTVSRVLGGDTAAFTPATVAKVQEAAAALAYRKNIHALATQSRRTGGVAVMVDPKQYRSHMPMPLLLAVQAQLAAAGLHVVVDRVADEALSEAEFIPKVLTHQVVDGLLLNYQVELPVHFRQFLQRSRIPTVWMNVSRPTWSVFPDEAGAARNLVDACVGAGFQRIVYADPTASRIPPERRHYSRADRAAGYRRGMAEHGLPADEWPDWPNGSIAAALDTLLANPEPTALLMGEPSPDIIRALWMHCVERKVDLGSRLVLATFGSDLFVEQVPALLARPDWQAVAQAAVSMLLNALDSANARAPTSQAIPSRIGPTAWLPDWPTHH